MNRSILAAAVGAAGAVLAVTACASSSSSAPNAARASAVTTSAAASRAATATAAAPSATSYPDQAADQALCNTYQSDIAEGDWQDLAQAVQQAEGSVTPALASDVMNVANGQGSVQQDTQHMVYVSMDCALVQAGKQPVNLHK